MNPACSSLRGELIYWVYIPRGPPNPNSQLSSFEFTGLFQPLTLPGSKVVEASLWHLQEVWTISLFEAG